MPPPGTRDRDSMGPPTTPTTHAPGGWGGNAIFATRRIPSTPLFACAESQTASNSGPAGKVTVLENLQPNTNRLGSDDSVGGSCPPTPRFGEPDIPRTPTGKGSHLGGLQPPNLAHSGGFSTTFSSLGFSILSAGQLAKRCRLGEGGAESDCGPSVADTEEGPAQRTQAARGRGASPVDLFFLVTRNDKQRAVGELPPWTCSLQQEMPGEEVVQVASVQPPPHLEGSFGETGGTATTA